MLLELTSRGEHLNETNYVAISYRWASDAHGTSPSQPDHEEIFVTNSVQGTRPSRAPARILRRAINYAIAHEVPYIWIDQECINQEDPADQEPGIQAMDIVYRRAGHTIALLETWISSQRALDSLSHACWQDEGSHFNSDYDDQQAAVLMQIFSNIAKDPWFTRAWTYQEKCCARYRLQLLIPCNFRPSDSESRLGQTLGEAELSFSVASRLVGACYLSAFTSALAGSMFVESKDVFRKFGFGERSKARYLPTGLGMSAENVVEDLETLHCRFEADKIAIMANLCNYERRLDTRTLVSNGYDLSTCMLALAAINGDVSFLDSFAMPQTFRTIQSASQKDALPSTAKNFLRKREWQKWNDDAAQDPRLLEVSVALSGFRSRGWVWIVDQKLEFPELREKHGTILYETTPCFFEFGWDMVRALQKRNLLSLAETVSRCIGEESEEAARDWAWARASRSSPSPVSLVTDRITGSSHWFFLLCAHWIQHGFIWAGSRTRGGEPTALFQCDGPCTIFTSTNIDLDCAEEPLFNYNHVVLEVEEIAGDNRSQPRPLAYKGRWAGGFWYGSKDSSALYSFPWHHRRLR